MGKDTARALGSVMRQKLRIWMRLFGVLTELRDNCRGNIAIITALSMPVLIGGAGMGLEASYWYYAHRAMQNAADAAAVAAATNATSSYDVEAKAVAARYGFQDGVNNVAVTPTNTATCPSTGTSTCYGVTVTSAVPLYLSQAVGFTGTTKINGTPYTALAAGAIAKSATHQYCLLALASNGLEGIRTNGAPDADMQGCDVMSNTTATCSGHNLSADYGDAHGTNSGCGVVENSNYPTVADPYSGLAANIPADTCGGSFPQEPAKKKDPALPASNKWSGSKALSGNVTVCGDLQLTSNVTINAPSGAVLVIRNGQLDTNGYTLQTSSGSSLTVIFTGSSGSYTHAPTGGGTLDIAAPNSGTWSGVAIYQDPGLTAGVNMAAAGNSPTWDISGLVYLPHSSVTFSGAVNKASNGQSCFGMVVDNILINGTGSILAHGDCAAAGLTLPQGSKRGQLVY